MGSVKYLNTFRSDIRYFVTLLETYLDFHNNNNPDLYTIWSFDIE
jgi:hypothetical protein